MARKGQHSFAKRQREQRKAEKALQKQARREERLNPTEPVTESTEDVPALDDDSDIGDEGAPPAAT